MKAIAMAVFVTLTMASITGGSPANSGSYDPCGGKNSNVEMRECYAREQTRVSAETDSLASRVAAQFRKDADDPSAKGAEADSLRKAASAVKESQEICRAYRDKHCSAVAYSWTTGSGAGTAHEACMFELGQARLRQLRADFDQELR